MRHPEHSRFLEEDWLFEAVVETYLPLLLMLSRLEDDGIPGEITIGLTPTLCAMLRDPLLQVRCTAYLDRALRIAGDEEARCGGDSDRPRQRLARFYLQRLGELRAAWENRWQRDLVSAFRDFQDRGRLEIMASAGTHGILPLAGSSETIHAQIEAGCRAYRHYFGRDPRGFWLPECAYSEAIDPQLGACGIKWFVLEAHGLHHAAPTPANGLFKPCRTRDGIAVFARDPVSSQQVWSADSGYPGAPAYRDFYRDIGHELPLSDLQGYLGGEPDRRFTGLKFHRITGETEDKELYEPETAAALAAQHAHHFAKARAAQLAAIAPYVDGEPAVVCAVDAEHFGHWWFEGPLFLEAFIRDASSEESPRPGRFRLSTPSSYLETNDWLERIDPAASTWGRQGHLETWLSEENRWIYPHLHAAAERLVILARHAAAGAPSPLQSRCLDQMARELLLAQSSDWAFLISTGTARSYAEKRIRDHLHRFRALFDQVIAGKIDPAFLETCEDRDRLFPGIDWKLYIPVAS